MEPSQLAGPAIGLAIRLFRVRVPLRPLYGFGLSRSEFKSSSTLVNNRLFSSQQLRFFILLCAIWVICFIYLSGVPVKQPENHYEQTFIITFKLVKQWIYSCLPSFQHHLKLKMSLVVKRQLFFPGVPLYMCVFP